MAEIVISLTVGEFRRVALERVERIVRTLGEREDLAATHEFRKPTPTALLRHRTERDLLQCVERCVCELVVAHPKFEALGRTLNALVERFSQASLPSQLVAAFEAL